MSGTEMSVALRVAKDGSFRRVSLELDERGSASATLRRQIGCDLFQLIVLDDELDMWVDEEALVHVDFDDRAQLAAEVNPVATMITSQIGGRLRQPIFGVALFTSRAGGKAAGLSSAQLSRLESLAALSAGVLAVVDGEHAPSGNAR